MKRWKKTAVLLLVCIMVTMPMTAQAGAAETAVLHLQIEQITEALQPLADAFVPGVAGHNVRIENYSDANRRGIIHQSVGSGVILAVDQNFVYIATAAHCTKYGNTKVTFADGTEHAAVVGYRNPAKDVGFLVVGLAGLTLETQAAISPAPGMDAREAGKVQGDLLYAISSSEVPNGAAYGGTLDCYSVEYPNHPEQNVLQFYASVSYGSSGGAVYTPEGIWVASISGGDTFGTCWAVPYSDILAEFHTWFSVMSVQ